MPRRLLSMLFLLPGCSVANELCKDLSSDIEPDMRILESDLTTPAAREAVEQLRPLLDLSERDQVQAFGIANRLQRLTGYTLRQQALEDIQRFGPGSEQAGTSARAFCSWLATRGFWYD